jgi:hypothetical protein
MPHSQAARSRQKKRLALPDPQHDTSSRERCTFCGAEAVRSMQGSNGRIPFCLDCAMDVGMAFTGCTISDPIERNEHIKRTVFKRKELDMAAKRAVATREDDRSLGG